MSTGISLGQIPDDNAGNTLDTANNLGTLGTTPTVANDFVGNFNGLATDDTDYYQFTLDENSTVNLKLSGLSQDATLYLYDNQGFVIQYSATSGNDDKIITRHLKPGTYYVSVLHGGEGTTYQLAASAIYLGPVPVDNAGNTLDTAKNLGTLGTTPTVANDFIGDFNGLATDDTDYYQFNLAENSTVNLKLSGLSQDATLDLYDNQGFVIQYSATPDNADEIITRNLRPGIYYVSVLHGGEGTTYQLEASAISLGAVPVDNAGDSFERAKNLGTLGTTPTVANDFVGNFNGLATDYIDYYQFTLDENSTINIKVSGLSQYVNLRLYDNQGQVVILDASRQGGRGEYALSIAPENAGENLSRNLRAGTYYVEVNNGGIKGTNYQFEVSAVSLGAVPVDNAGDSFERAKNLGTLGTTPTVANDFLGNFNDLATDYYDYYQFTLAENSTVDLKLSSLNQYLALYLYDSQGKSVQIDNDKNITRNLRAGTYYVSISGGGTGTNYQFEASAVSLGAVPVDNAGDSFERAKNLGTLSTTPTVANDFLGNFNDLATDYNDYYQFTLAENSTVNLKLSGLSQDVSVILYDSQGQSTGIFGNGEQNITGNLRTGTYYVSVYGVGNGTNYQFEASAISLGNTPVDDNPINTASDLGTLGAVVKTVDLQVNNSVLNSYYKFTLGENSTVNLQVSGFNEYTNLSLLYSNGNTIFNSVNLGNIDENISKNLKAGIYYLQVYGSGNDTTYKLDASAVSLGAFPVDNAGQNIDTAKNFGVLTSDIISSTDFVGNFNGLASDDDDYYKFTLAENSTINLNLSGLSQDANLNLYLRSSNGNLIQESTQPGNVDENISRNLKAGIYYLQVHDGGSVNGTNYKLDTSAISLGAFPVDNAGQNIDTAKDIGILKSEVISLTDYVGYFHGLAADNDDYYKFTLTENSTVNFKVSGLSQDANLGLGQNADLYLLSRNGNLINVSYNPGNADEIISQNLKADTYYLHVSNGGNGTTYKLDASATSLGGIPIDTAGQTIDTARDLGVISSPQQISEYIGNFNNLANDYIDYYKFRVTSDSFMRFSVTGASNSPNLQLFNRDGNFITRPVSNNIFQGLTAGTYYLAVTPTPNNGTNYQLNASANLIPDFAGNDNQTARDVGVLNSARSFTDFVGSIDYADFYRFELKEKSAFNLNFNPERSSNGIVRLTNAQGQWLTDINTEVNSFSQDLGPGVYYAQIYNSGWANTDTIYNLSLSAIPKQISGFQISGVNPIVGSNQGETTINIKGTKFTPNAKVSIIDPTGKEVNSSTVTVLDDSHIAAKFDLKGQVTGAYDVKVVDQAGLASVNDIFLVNDLQPGRLRVDITAAPVRAFGTGEAIITYRNAGNTDIPAPLLTLIADGAVLEESGEFKDNKIQFLGINKEGNAGVLPAGASASMRVRFRSLGGFAINLQVNSLALDENVDWNGIKDSSRPDGIAADVWDKIYSNFVSSVGGKASEFQKVLDDNANRLSQLGEYTGDISRLLSFELQQVNSNGISARSTVGAFGRGGVNPWDVTAITDQDGNVAIQTGDRRRTFTKDSDRTYKASNDDFGILTKQGDIYQIKEIDGTVQSFKADGKLDFIQDTNQNKVTLGYTNNLLTGLNYSNGDKVTFKYNPQGRVSEVVDIYGQSTTYTYDATGERLLSVSDVSGTVSYTYETEGAKANAIKSITYPDGTQSLFEYDDLGRVTKESLNGGEQTLKYSYDSTGGVTVTDANNKSTQVLLNDRGQVAETKDALGRITRFSYDSKGNLTQVLAPDSSNAKFTYDSKGNLLASTDALGQSVQFTYDSRYDQIGSVSDQKGNAINYNYDDQGNLTSINYADDSKESFSYNNKGDVTVSSNRRGQQINYTYDSRGLLTKKQFADGTAATFEYDLRGNLTKATDADSSVTYNYDTADRLTKVSYGNTRFLSFSYDAGGRRSQMVDQDGFATNYGYDGVGRLKQLTDKDGKNIVSYSYDALGQLTREDNGNGTYTTYAYDDAGQTLSIVNYKPDNSINSRFDYTYNQLGQRTSLTTLGGKTSYGYDAIGQLISVDLPNGRSIEYKYDAAGNRITVKDSGATTSYSTNNLNQYTTVGGDIYSYDKDGNLTSKTVGGKTSTFSYDIENRLIGVKNADGNWQYQYDALGNRIGSTFNGQKTDYLLDPTGLGDVVGEYTGSQATRYSYGLGLVSRNDGSNTSFFDTDAIGSVVGLSGTGGNYLNSYSYLPFGESLTKTETVANSFEYVGQFGVMNEANGLDFMRARFYTPGEGRFLNPDAIGIKGGVNLYAYTGNNPSNAIDPLGLKPKYKNTYALGVGLHEFFNTSPIGNPDREAQDNYGSGDVWRTEQQSQKDIKARTSAVPLVQQGAKAGQELLEIIFPSPQDLKKAWDDTKKGKIPKATGILDPQFIPNFGEYLKDLGDGLTNGSKRQLPLSLDPKAQAQVSQPPRAIDPNDIIGPIGTGAEQWLTAYPVLPYTIRFENLASATAAAVLVNITHTLDSDLDLNTFELGDFGFGSLFITVPEGLQTYSTRLDLRDTIGDFVDFTARLDPNTRTVTWKLAAIDPLTGQLAEGVTDGFLPPNNANHDGEGFVNYRIKSKGDVANGTSIDAKASIVFDTNDPIETPVWSNKIDTALPSSQVTSLPAKNSPNFNVTWTGADNGSGVAKYDIYVSDNGGDFTIWKQGITDTSATYTGELNHIYRFYSVATDGVGFQESAPNQADASTTVVLVNNSPIVEKAIADQNAKQGNAFNFQIPTNTFTDIDAGDVLTYSATLENGDALPSWLTFNAATGIFSGTPSNDNVGNLNVKVTAKDNSGANVTDIFAIAVENVNDAPIAENAIADQTTTADVTFNFTFDANTFSDIDAGDSLTYSAKLKNGDNLPLWLKFNSVTRTFSGTPTKSDVGSFAIDVRATDNSGVSVTDTFLLDVKPSHLEPTLKLSKIGDDIFNITNSIAKSKLQVTLTGQSSNLVNELGVFTVDDAQGKINGIAPGTAGYAQAALERAKVIFSAIANLPNGFNNNNLTHLLEFNSGDNLRFYLLKNSTTDAVKAGVTPLTDILFSEPLTQKITDLGNNNFSLAWKDGSGNNAADFNNLVVKIQPTNDSLPLGTNLQGKFPGELIDLRGVTNQVKADFTVNREAAFNNFIGFYEVADENGGIDTNGDGKVDILTGQAGYTQAAIRGRVAGIDLTVNNQGTATYTGIFQPGSIFAPFIIANGTPDALLDSNPNNDPAVYFPFLGANADKVDHIRLLGNNIFGFEDLANGGDKDFNDAIARVNLSIV